MRVTASCLFAHMWEDHVGTKCAFATGISCMCFPKQAHSRLHQTWLHFHCQAQRQTRKHCTYPNFLSQSEQWEMITTNIWERKNRLVLLHSLCDWIDLSCPLLEVGASKRSISDMIYLCRSTGSEQPELSLNENNSCRLPPDELPRISCF